MAQLPDSLFSLLAELEARLHELDTSVDDDADASLSINMWLDRIRGAGMEAQMHARGGNVGLEERAWLELAAISLRRILTIRKLAP